MKISKLTFYYFPLLALIGCGPSVDWVNREEIVAEENLLRAKCETLCIEKYGAASKASFSVLETNHCFCERREPTTYTATVLTGDVYATANDWENWSKKSGQAHTGKRKESK